GKTRLALHAATNLTTEFSDGVFFVELAPVTNADLVLPTIAHAVGLQDVGPESTIDRLARVLQNRRILLVLDNFEQVLDAAPSLAKVIAGSPAATFLVTSRVPLKVSGEQELPVPPLALPQTDVTGSAELATSPTVRLFIQRARAASPSFALTESNVRTVADITRQLGGVPLAIELAATRIKILPPDLLLARLSQGLDLLSDGPRDKPPRQRDMRTTIAWSCDLLSSEQRTLFRWLAMFAGGCRLDAAETIAAHIAGKDASQSGAPLALVAALVDASLVSREVSPTGPPRITLLEPIRQFGLERLEASAEHTVARDWFVSWCLDLAERVTAAFSGKGPGQWIQRLAQERANIREALDWLDRQNDAETAVRLLTAFAPLWTALGHEREGYHRVTRILDQHKDGIPGELKVHALALAARLANSLGNLEAASELAHAGLALVTESEGDRGSADLHCVLGNIARGLNDSHAARAHYERALDCYRAVDDTFNTGYTLIQMAKLGTVGQSASATDLQRAVHQCEAALDIYRTLGNTWGTARALHQLGHLTYKSREFTRAARLSSESLELFWMDGNLTEAASPLEDLADVAGATGHADTAARFYGASEALRERLGAPIWPAYREEYEREIAIAREGLATSQFDHAWQTGRSLPMATVVTEARRFADDLASSTPNPTRISRTTLADHHGLTARELDVIRLVAMGHSNQEIADTLFIGVTTVKSHIRNVLRKLGLNSRTAIAAWVHQQRFD
ncbi:MAG TPA: LuxR C-terminal-related transcriptional regulator, partial [Thermomicrobiales bacterium]|nr:LuxR C-terminal-related transcriptional regulator [Thermomicrobiales bacterium]